MKLKVYSVKSVMRSNRLPLSKKSLKLNFSLKSAINFLTLPRICPESANCAEESLKTAGLTKLLDKS